MLKRSKLNALCENHFNKTFKAATVSEKIVKTVEIALKKASTADTRDTLHKFLESLREKCSNAANKQRLIFLNSAIDIFCNFKDAGNIPSFPDEVQFETLQTLSSHLNIGPRTHTVYVKIPHTFFYKSDLINYRIVQKLNFALMIVADVLKQSEKFNENSFELKSDHRDDSALPCSLFDFCHLSLSSGADHLKLKCVVENDNLFDTEQLSLDKNLLRSSYFGCEEKTVSSLVYNQKVINSFVEVELHRKLLTGLEQMPIANKLCVKIFHLWAKRCGVEMFIDLPFITSAMIHLMETNDITTSTHTGALFNLFRDFCGRIQKLLSPTLDSTGVKHKKFSFICPIQPQYDHFVDFTAEHGQLLKYHLKSLCQTLETLNPRHQFEELFLRPTNSFIHFDLFLQLRVNCFGISEAAKPEEKIESNCNVLNIVIDKCCTKLRQALGTRCSLVVPLQKKDNEKPTKCSANSVTVVFGVKLNFSYQREAVIKGPPPQQPEAVAEFLELWGSDFCKLRQFKDGTVCYSVTFPEHSGNQMQLRKVSAAIATRIISHQLGKENVISLQTVSNVFDPTMAKNIYSKTEKFSKQSTGEEIVQTAANCLADFEKYMMDLSKKLPLTVKSILCLEDSLCRNTSVINPMIEDDLEEHSDATSLFHGKVRIPKDLLNDTRKILPVRIQIILETHSHWPSNDIKAVNYLKTAFYFKMQELLDAERSGYACYPTDSCLYIVHQKILFIASIFHPPEIEMLKKPLTNKQGALLWVHSKASAALLLEQVQKPELMAMMQGFEQFFPQFGALCRYVKYWVDSQLLLFHFGHLAVELLVAAMLENSYDAGRVSNSVQSGLLEFWSFMSTFDFGANFLFVHLDDPALRANAEKSQTMESKVCLIAKKFDFNRASFPPLALFTRGCTEKAIFTSHVSELVLKRLSKLSSEAFSVASKGCFEALASQDELSIETLKQLFVMNYQGFDVNITLQESKGVVRKVAKRQKFSGSVISSVNVIPVFGASPMFYVADRINHKMGHVFLVFCSTFDSDNKQIALKFRKDMEISLKNWTTKNKTDVISELVLLIGQDLIKTMDVTSDVSS